MLGNGIAYNKVNLKVKVNTESSVFKRVVKWEHSEIIRVLRGQMNTEGLEVSLEELEKYMKALIQIRVKLVHQDSKVKKLYKTRQLLVPTRFYVLLNQIGEAYDPFFNIRFDLDTEGITESDDLMTPTDMFDVSEKLQRLQGYGYTIEKGIPLNVEGDLGTMSSFVLNDADEVKKIFSYKPDHPVKAFYAAVLGLIPVSHSYSELSLLFRFDYGTAEDFEFEVAEQYSQAKSPSFKTKPKQDKVVTNDDETDTID